MENDAVASRDIDFIADGDILQKTEMRIAVRGIDRHAALAGIGGELDVARPEGKRLAAASGQHDGAGVEPFHLDARDRPGIRP